MSNISFNKILSNKHLIKLFIQMHLKLKSMPTMRDTREKTITKIFKIRLNGEK